MTVNVMICFGGLPCVDRCSRANRSVVEIHSVSQPCRVRQGRFASVTNGSLLTDVSAGDLLFTS